MCSPQEGGCAEPFWTSKDEGHASPVVVPFGMSGEEVWCYEIAEKCSLFRLKGKKVQPCGVEVKTVVAAGMDGTDVLLVDAVDHKTSAKTLWRIKNISEKKQVASFDMTWKPQVVTIEDGREVVIWGNTVTPIQKGHSDFVKRIAKQEKSSIFVRGDDLYYASAGRHVRIDPQGNEYDPTKDTIPTTIKHLMHKSYGRVTRVDSNGIEHNLNIDLPNMDSTNPHLAVDSQGNFYYLRMRSGICVDVVSSDNVHRELAMLPEPPDGAFVLDESHHRLFLSTPLAQLVDPEDEWCDEFYYVYSVYAINTSDDNTTSPPTKKKQKKK